MIRTIQPEHLTGRLVILPALNLPAVRAATRVSPVDGRNLNRTYPGALRGDATQQIAYAVTERLLPSADYALDLHSGGSASFYLPSAYVYQGPNPDMFRRKKAAAELLGLPWSIQVVPRQGPSTFSAAADNAGVCMIATELAGGGMLTSALIDRLSQGLSRLLVGWGVLKAEFGPPDLGGTQWIRFDEDSTIYTPVRGLFEPECRLGDHLSSGERVGWIYPFEELNEPARPVAAPRDGIVTILRRPPLVDLGDALFTLASEV
ncbi:succinylglutamate desuccinylase/aspartoacylase family protein [Leekyejoonella antrihumi]